MEKRNQKNNPFPEHRGSEELINKYNINDQAHSDSSIDDFIKTVSEFHHSDETSDKAPDNNDDYEKTN